MTGLVGETAMDCRVAVVTLRVVEPEVRPELAVIVVVPAAREVALPATSIAATELLEEVQATADVRSCVLLSVKVPMAVNCWDVPLAMLELVGVTATDRSVAVVTVRVVVPVLPPVVALMVVEPAARAEAIPAAFMVAVVVVDELQVTTSVRSCVELSE